LWKARNLLITPHVAGDSDRFIQRVFKRIREQVESFVRGKELINIVTGDYRKSGSAKCLKQSAKCSKQYDIMIAFARMRNTLVHQPNASAAIDIRNGVCHAMVATSFSLFGSGDTFLGYGRGQPRFWLAAGGQ
jgi:hypothetical protein